MVEDGCNVNLVPHAGNDTIATLIFKVKADAAYGNSSIAVGTDTKVAAIGSTINALASTTPATITIAEQPVNATTFTFSTKIQGLTDQMINGTITETLSRKAFVTFVSTDGSTTKTYETTMEASPATQGVFAPVIPILVDDLPVNGEYYIYVKGEFTLRQKIGEIPGSTNNLPTPLTINEGANAVPSDWVIPTLTVGDLVIDPVQEANKINFEDIMDMVTLFREPPVDSSNADYQTKYDLYLDGMIDFEDVMILMTNYTESPRCGELLEGEICE